MRRTETRSLKRLAILAAALLTLTGPLAACRKAPVADPASPEVRFNPPILARGNEPFWSVKLEGTRMVLQRPDQPDVVAKTALTQLTPSFATWIGKTGDGREVRLALVRDTCSDGMSDREYPIAAEVTYEGQVLKGCAERTAP